ncbi:MAG: glycosyltransferase family 2 protein [Lachnospiraceae bacterium]|uniref:Glycosyltransferase family 2 protein n=1 Tax=Candidatus Weimeria bifida TaxID=2599074 RepID=A0A6N7J2U0_9FIRM|nr:glycosyltransferase family 2 protein [Candidatus Weimeria bifida]RRF97364.1 MAG: glycosyltransferase family 2 protein [Lachnospiraceae bacterium]
MNEKVSIITPCYNGAKYVGETIESVLAQDYTDWEMIIVNDGSSDNSCDIVSSYAAKDPRITLINQPNGGSAKARNNGIEHANGRYIALLDADDLWNPDFLSSQVSFLKEKNAAVVCSSYAHIDADSKVFGKVDVAKPVITLKDMYVMNRIGCLTGLYDAGTYGKVYLREELKSLRDDYAYWIDCVKKTGVAYGNQKVLARYRVLDTSTTGNKKKLIKVQWHFYRDYLHLNPFRASANLVQWGIAGLRKFGNSNV